MENLPSDNPRDSHVPVVVAESRYVNPIESQLCPQYQDSSSQSYTANPSWSQDPLSLADPGNYDLCSLDYLDFDSFVSSGFVSGSNDLVQTSTAFGPAEQYDQNAGNDFRPDSIQNYSNVSEWIEGAYQPTSACSYCLQNRLQCLVLRTDPANPNPVTSCASCVALFRECSMARGSKRLPAEFETMAPGMGQLHGVIEENDNGMPLFVSVAERAESAGVTNTGKPMSRRSIRPLKEWMLANQDYPFPSHEDKSLLESQTGLTKVQINNWFANERRRQKRRQATMSPLPSTQARRLSDTDGQLLAMDPMERWENSPPESEPVQLSMVAKAAEALDLPHPQGQGYGGCFSSYSGASRNPTASVTSYDTGLSDTSNGSSTSAWSDRSHRLVEKRKRRSRRRSARPETTTATAVDARCIYQCTFCGEGFSKSYDWQRHEQSLHLPMERWVCSPTGPLMTWPQDEDSPRCLFCQERSPTTEHLATHDAEACLERPAAERTFSRKDHLRQHLKKYHGCLNPSSLDWLLDSWKVENPNFRSRCGFCGRWFAAWKERATHLSWHFQQGARMTEWTGHYGFDEESQKLLTGVVVDLNINPALETG
ncbi:hypothetical protein BP6252_04066 [Coleophoma cylindrospora]|uniref:Uncharacterized protein n=1 Tax=Coleophoma cylindrospora TaxID=1849047 RepID=A0A3D8RZI3_9HELO|nr:hypothetical protein BP6252_04066 [Coleophoma cylindrospora]